MTQPYNLSPELVGWVGRHKEDILGKLQISPLKLERGKEHFMKRIIKAPQFLSDTWSELIQIMEELKAPPDVLSEDREIAPVLSANLKGISFSNAQQDELLALVEPLETAKTDIEKLSILQEATQQGKLSKLLANRIIPLVPNSELYQSRQESANSEPGIAMMRFNWGACGFCGALGLEGGAVGAGVACVVCGLLA